MPAFFQQHNQISSRRRRGYGLKYLSLSLVIALTLSGQGGGNRLQVLVVGHAGLAVGLVLMDRLHDDAYWEEGGRLGDAGI